MNVVHVFHIYSELQPAFLDLNGRNQLFACNPLSIQLSLVFEILEFVIEDLPTESIELNDQ